MMTRFDPDFKTDMKELQSIWKRRTVGTSPIDRVALHRPKTEVKIRLTTEEMSRAFLTSRDDPALSFQKGYKPTKLLDEFIRINGIELLDDGVYIPSLWRFDKKKKHLLNSFVELWALKRQLAQAVQVPQVYLFPDEVTRDKFSQERIDGQ